MNVRGHADDAVVKLAESALPKAFRKVYSFGGGKKGKGAVFDYDQG